jgi:3-deoxy-D-manno-octulosonate 8-phosphate phosphatase (KDO 8-P phosphatase)
VRSERLNKPGVSEALRADIRLLAADVDGTLTDGGMYYFPSGEIVKRFNVRDGLAVKLLRAVGIQVAFISSDDSPLVAARAKRLGLDHYYAGTTDKVHAAEEICAATGFSLANIAYLGDDLQDYELMREVGIAAAVGDAHPVIKNCADHICQAPGGGGAFRELAEWLIEGQGHEIEDVWRVFLDEGEDKGA